MLQAPSYLTPLRPQGLPPSVLLGTSDDSQATLELAVVQTSMDRGRRPEQRLRQLPGPYGQPSPPAAAC